MTKSHQGRSITPMATDEEGGGDHALGPIRDPLADATDVLGNDPSLGELIAVRDHAPDLKVVAREAKRCNDDPLHQQAAIRHLVSEANWIAKRFRFGGTLVLDPAWMPIV